MPNCHIIIVIEMVSPVFGHFHYLGLFFLLILGGLGFPFPEDATLMLCGFLIASKAVSPVPALLVVYSGLLITDFFLYALGRKYGPNIVNHEKFRKIISRERLLKLETRFRKREILFILFGRHFIGLRAQIFIVSGIMKMHPLKFLISDAVSSVFTITLMVGAGYTGGNSLQVIRKDMLKVQHITILVAVVCAVIFFMFKFYKYRHERAGMGGH